MDLRLHHVLFQLVAGDAVGEHTAGLLVLFKHRGGIALEGQEIGAAQPRRAGADDGDLLLEAPQELWHHLFRDIPGGGLQILLGDELFHPVDGHRLVHGTPGTGVLAAAVAHPAAYRREGVFLFDEGQGLGIAALGRHFQIALHGNVGGACGFTGGGAGGVGVDPIVVPVVDVPLFRAPLHQIRQLLLGIGDGAGLGAQLLPQAHRPCRAIFHAPAAGHAVFRSHLRHVGGAGHVRSIKQLAGAQGVAHVDVAIADGEDLVFPVDVGDLVDKAVVLGLFQDVQDLLIGDVPAALVGFHHVVRHVPHGDAPALRVVAAALAHAGPGHAAGAGGGRVLARVFLQPVADMLDIRGLVFGFDGLFHRDHMHTDARAARGHHGGDVLQGQEGHPLEKGGDLGFFVDLLLVHVEKFRAARHKGRQGILLFPAGILPVVFHQANAAHLRQQRLQLLRGLAGKLYKLRQGLGVPDVHL